MSADPIAAMLADAYVAKYAKPKPANPTLDWALWAVERGDEPDIAALGSADLLAVQLAQEAIIRRAALERVRGVLARGVEPLEEDLEMLRRDRAAYLSYLDARDEAEARFGELRCEP